MFVFRKVSFRPLHSLLLVLAGLEKDCVAQEAGCRAGLLRTLHGRQRFRGLECVVAHCATAPGLLEEARPYSSTVQGWFLLGQVRCSRRCLCHRQNRPRCVLNLGRFLRVVGRGRSRSRSRSRLGCLRRPCGRQFLWNRGSPARRQAWWCKGEWIPRRMQRKTPGT